jgi:ABC-type amino acid transport substrate-binding protein
MNRKRYFILLFLSAVLFLFWTVFPVYAGVLEDIKSKGQLVVSTDANYAPQSFLNDKGELDGFDIDVSKEVAKRMGAKIKFVTPDWDLIVAGKWGARWDLSIGSMTITSARAKVVDFSSPYYYTPAQFGVHKKTARPSGVGQGRPMRPIWIPIRNSALAVGRRSPNKCKRSRREFTQPIWRPCRIWPLEMG